MEGGGPTTAEGAVNSVDRSCTPLAWFFVSFLVIGLDRSETFIDRPEENPLPLHSSNPRSWT